jgi:MFS family permease
MILHFNFFSKVFGKKNRARATFITGLCPKCRRFNVKKGNSPSNFCTLHWKSSDFKYDIVPSTISPNAKITLLGVILQGFSNGITGAVLQLYIVSLGYQSQSLGTILMMNALGSMILTVPAGLIADRIGKRKMILVSFAALTLSWIVFFIADSTALFALSFLLMGVSNAAGTVITPLYSSFFKGEDMNRAFGLWGLLNLSTMSLGSLAGFIPLYLVASAGMSLTQAYRYTMIAAAIINVAQSPIFYLSSLGIQETLSRGTEFRLKSYRIILKICCIGFLTNVAGGILFSLFPYYVNKKFGVDSASLGTLLFISNLAMALSNGMAAGIAKRLGSLRSIAAGVALSGISILFMPFSPSFNVLAIFYILRSCTSVISDPLLTSIFMRSTSDDEKSTANSLRMVSMNASGVVAPRLGGSLMEQVGLDSPSYIGGVFTLVAAALYSFVLRDESKLHEKNNLATTTA